MENFLKSSLLFVCCLLIGGLVVAATTTDTAALVTLSGFGKKVTTSYESLLLLCFVPTAWTATQIMNVNSEWKPVVVQVIGVIAALTGLLFFNVGFDTALLAYTSSLASGNMHSLLKKTLPLVIALLQRKKNE